MDIMDKQVFAQDGYFFFIRANAPHHMVNVYLQNIKRPNREGKKAAAGYTLLRKNAKHFSHRQVAEAFLAFLQDDTRVMNAGPHVIVYEKVGYSDEALRLSGRAVATGDAL